MKLRIARLIALLLVAFACSSAPAQAQQVGYVNWVNLHSAYVRADFTDANAAGGQAIPGLLFYLPAGQSAVYRLDCEFAFSQATAAADSLGITFGVAPTSTSLWGIMATNATAFASIAPVNITGTGNTAVVTGTPAVATVLGAGIHGYIEVASAAADISVQITIAQGTAANVVVIKRDSGCTWHSMQ